MVGVHHHFRETPHGGDPNHVSFRPGMILQVTADPGQSPASLGIARAREMAPAHLQRRFALGVHDGLRGVLLGPLFFMAL